MLKILSQILTSFSQIFTSFSQIFTSFSQILSSFCQILTSFSQILTSFSQILTSSSQILTSFSQIFISFRQRFVQFYDNFKLESCLWHELIFFQVTKNQRKGKWNRDKKDHLSPMNGILCWLNKWFVDTNGIKIMSSQRQKYVTTIIFHTYL